MTNTVAPGRPETPARLVDIAAGVILAAISLVALLWLVPTYTVVTASAHDVSATFIPNLAAVVVLVLALVLVAQAVSTRAGVGPKSHGRRTFTEIGIWAVTATALMIGIKALGLTITAGIFIAAGAIYGGYRRFWILSVLAITFPLIVERAVWFGFVVKLP